MKILMYYAHFPMSIALYWRRALQSLGHEVVTAGPYTGGQIPWPGNPDLSAHADVPTLEMPMNNVGHVTPELLALSHGCDLAISVDAAWSLKGGFNIPKIIIGTDPHCIDYSFQRGDCDLFIVMQQHYAVSGDVWIPYAYDPEWHVPRAATVDHDVSFVGVLYDVRTQELAAMQRAGLRIENKTGPIGHEYAEVYSRGKFAYCRSSEQDLAARYYEGLAMGQVVVQNRIKELHHVNDSYGLPYYDPISQYTSVEEAIGEMRRLLGDEASYRQLAQAGYDWVTNGHSWDDRVRRLLGVCKERGLIS